MKTSRKNTFAYGAWGSAGNMTIRRRRGKEAVISTKSSGSSVPPTADQIGIRRRFRLSSDYFKLLKQDPEKMAVYTAAVRPGRSAYNIVVKDFNTSPVVESIVSTEYTGQAGEAIIVKAFDDFKVVSVRVSIFAAGGQLLERGDAITQPNQLDWKYTTTVANAQLAGSKIVAVASDLPANTGTLEVIL